MPPTALLLAGAILGCRGSAPAPLGGELNLYAFSAYIPQGMIAGFEKRTGVRVVLDTYESNEEMAAGLAAWADHYDIVIPSDYMVEELVARKALTPLDLGRIPGWTHIDSRFRSPYFDPGGIISGRRSYTSGSDKFSIPFQWGTTGIAWNASKVEPPPARWADLWRPDLAGHLVVLDDSREMLGIGLLSLGHSKNDTDPAHIAEAGRKVTDLTKGSVVIDAEDPESELLSGEAWAGVVYNGNAVLAARQDPNILYTFPEEGAGIWFDSMAIPTGAPHPDAAYAFIQWVLEPENSVLITKEFPYSNPNRKALDWLEAHDPQAFSVYDGSPTTNPSPEMLAGARPVKRLSAETSSLYEQAWSEAKAARQGRAR